MFVTKIGDIKAVFVANSDKVKHQLNVVISTLAKMSLRIRLDSIHKLESKVQNARSLGILKNMGWGDLCSRLG